MHRIAAALLLFVALLASRLAAQTADSLQPVPGDSARVHDTAVRFLAAFDSLQWEPFRAAFAPDVTSFPWADPAGRREGRAVVEAAFREFFDGARAARAREGQTTPPFLGIGAGLRDLRVQMVGASGAVVSFHLRNGEAPPARRSFVFRREPDGAWRIVHFHASAAPRPTGP